MEVKKKKTLLKCAWNHKRSQIAKPLLSKQIKNQNKTTQKTKKQNCNLRISDFKIYITTITKTTWNCHQTDSWANGAK